MNKRQYKRKIRRIKHKFYKIWRKEACKKSAVEIAWPYRKELQEYNRKWKYFRKIYQFDGWHLNFQLLFDKYLKP